KGKADAIALQAADPGAYGSYDSSVSRDVPIFSVDSGLYFDRNTSLFGNNYRQTLEPRMFYLYVPYKDQKDIPLFDTGETLF
ncbi:LPS assembly protein LptD, partial [Escherichia coli]